MIAQEFLNRLTSAEDTARSVRRNVAGGVLPYAQAEDVAELANAVVQAVQTLREVLHELGEKQ